MKTRFFKFLLFGFALLFFLGCNQVKCDKMGKLFLINEYNRPIPFDSLRSVESTLNYLENQYCFQGDTLFPVFYYNIRKGEITESSRGAIEVSIEPVPCYSGLEYDFNQILEIKLDGNNILIEEKRMSVDSIAQYVFYQYLNYGRLEGFSRRPEGNGIWLITEKARPMSDFNEIIGEVLLGYRQAFEYLSEGLFGKKPCDITDDEWTILTSKMQFQMAIKYSDEEESILKVDDLIVE